jgi:hypothetical protein
MGVGWKSRLIRSIPLGRSTWVLSGTIRAARIYYRALGQALLSFG